MNESERLDQYLDALADALARGTDAPPPADLDADGAAFARLLARSLAENVSPPASAEAHVWERVQRAAGLARPIGPSSNGRQAVGRVSLDPAIQQEEPVTSLTLNPTLNPPRRLAGGVTRLPLTLAAALMVFVLFGGLLILMMRGPAGSPPYAAGLPVPTVTPTPAQAPAETPRPIEPNSEVSGSLSPAQPEAGFRLVPQMEGALLITVDAGAPVVLNYTTITQAIDGAGLTVDVQAGESVGSVAMRYCVPPDVLVERLGTDAPSAGSYRLNFTSGACGSEGGAIDSPALLTQVTPGQILTLTVQSAGSASVPFSLRTTYFHPAMLSSTQFIGYGDSVAGHLAEGQQMITYSFQAEAGDQISAAIQTPGQPDLRLFLFGPMGNLMGMDEDSGAGSDPELMGITLTQPGGYFLIVMPRNDLSGGDFRLSLERTGQDPAFASITDPALFEAATPIIPGEFVEASLTAEEAQAVFRLEPQADDQAYLVYYLAEGFTPYFEYSIEFASSGGGGGGGGGGGDEPSGGGQAMLFSAPAGARALLGVRDPLGQGGSVRVTALALTGPALEAGHAAEGELSAALPLGIHTFEGRAGMRVNLAATPEGEANLRLHVYDAQGVLLAVDDDSGAGLDPELTNLALPADGLYTVIVEAQGIDAASDAAIPYRLALTAPDAP